MRKSHKHSPEGQSWAERVRRGSVVQYRVQERASQGRTRSTSLRTGTGRHPSTTDTEGEMFKRVEEIFAFIYLVSCVRCLLGHFTTLKESS